jgi:hypothetical protein
MPIGASARHVLEIPRIGQTRANARCLEDPVQRNPVHARGFHRSRRDPARAQPLRQSLQVLGKRREDSDGVGIAVRGHRDVDLAPMAIARLVDLKHRPVGQAQALSPSPSALFLLCSS